MKLPEYVSVGEVKRVCKKLKLRDWTALKAPSIPMKEAKILLPIVNTDGMDIDIEEFRKGLVVELDHGFAFANFNVTNNHPVLTAKIVMAHFMEISQELAADRYTSFSAARSMSQKSSLL